MTIEYMCDRCGAPIAKKQTRYRLKMQLFAAYDGLEISPEDIARSRDIRAEIEQLVKEMEQMDETELAEQVYVDFEYDLCPKCRAQVYEQLKERTLI